MTAGAVRKLLMGIWLKTLLWIVLSVVVSFYYSPALRFGTSTNRMPQVKTHLWIAALIRTHNIYKSSHLNCLSSRTGCQVNKLSVHDFTYKHTEWSEKCALNMFPSEGCHDSPHSEVRCVRPWKLHKRFIACGGAIRWVQKCNTARQNAK